MVVILLLSFGWNSATAADDLKVLDNEAPRLLYRYLYYEAKAQYDARRHELVAALATKEATARRRERLHQDFLRLLGPLPEKTRLNARVVGHVDRDDYRIEKVIYESRPNHHVTANLYLPTKGKPPYPGVLLACGHSDNGKAYESYQAASVLHAKHGLVTLCFDPICQGERHQLLDAPLHGTSTHTLLNVGALLVGRSTVWYEAVDGLRSIDYLLSRPEVDRSKPIGLTGTSGGGTQTTFLMALDPRVGPAAPSCYLMTRLRKFMDIGPADGCQWLPGEGAAHIDHFDYVTMRADRPTLVLAANRDFFDIAATRAGADETRRVFAALEMDERFDMFESDDQHGFHKAHREACVRWMRRWMLDDHAPISEDYRFWPQEDKTLQVTKTGQVLKDNDDELSVTDFNLRRANELAADRRQFWSSGSEVARASSVRRLLGIDRHRLPRKTEEVAVVEGQGYQIETVKLLRESDVPLPAAIFKSHDGDPRRPVTLYVDGRGKSADAGSGGAIETLTKTGRIVMAVDLRGYGETKDHGDRGKYFNEEERVAALSMHIGRPLLGQRVQDIKDCLDYLGRRDDVDSAEIELVAIGLAGPVGLHAAYLDKRIARVRLRDSIRSWVDDVVAAPLRPHLMGHVVPHALETYDLTDLARALGDKVSVQSEVRTSAR